MRTIKVFLASSDELTYERLQFDSLFNHLNRIFRPRGLYLELSMWEYLDSSMGIKRKQEEYNAGIKVYQEMNPEYDPNVALDPDWDISY